MLCKKILLAITGPTAVGKTELGLRIAERLKRAEIISVDSRQLYRYMDIGTAKPTPEEQRRVKHHLIDIRDPDQSYSAGLFCRDSRALMERMWADDIVPLLVGGSGLYLQAALDGFFPIPEGDLTQIRARLQARLAAEGIEALYEELGRIDPVAQSRLAARDTQRILRALELAAISAPGQTNSPLSCIPLLFCLELDRDSLYRRIEQRVDGMVKGGLVEEVRGLVQRGYGRHCPALRTLGYLEILDFLEGRVALAEAIRQIKVRSRNYAKRQWTWFRRDRRLRWLDLGRWGMEGAEARVWAQYAAEVGGLE